MPNQVDAAAAAIRREILDLVERYHALAHVPPPFDPDVSPVPVAGRVYGAREMQFLVDSALDFWLTSGRFNDAFEERLAQCVGARHTLTVNSGSSANLIAFSALTSHKLKSRRLQPGDEVITCATGFPTTVNPAILWGMTPVFVDVHLPTYNIDVAALEAAVSSRTRAVMLAHTLGNPFDVLAIRAFCDKHDLFLIEDCCDALGATVHGKPVGMFGDIGTLSFYPAHHITMGEGGAVFTNNLMLAKVMESFRDWGRDCYCKPGCDNTCNNRFGWTLGDLPPGYDHKYIYSHLGFNLKITDMQAAVGLAQLDRLEGFISERRRNFATLQDGLKELEEYFILPASIEGADPSWFGYPLTLREGVSPTRDELVKALNARRIGTRLLFGGNLVRQPYMKERTFRAPAPLVNADIVVDRTFWIGLYPGLSEPALNYTIETLNDLLRGGRGSGRANGASVASSSPALSAPPDPNTASRSVATVMSHSWNILLDPLLARFVTVGVLNTVVGYTLFIAALAVSPSSFVALVASYMLALSFNFLSTGGYVFGSTSPDRLIPFFGAHALILTFQAIALRALEAIGMASWAAGLFLLPVAVVMSFILNKYVVFGRRQ